MTAAGWGQLAALIVLLVVTAPPLGCYIARVYEGGPMVGDRLARPVERLIYRVCRIDPESEQLLDANPMAQRLSGFSRAELLRMPISYFFRSDVQGGLNRLRHAYRKTGTFHSQEGFFLRHECGGVWVPVWLLTMDPSGLPMRSSWLTDPLWSDSLAPSFRVTG